MAARAGYPLSVDELELAQQQMRNENRTSLRGFEFTESELLASIPVTSDLNEILRLWNLGVSIYRSNSPDKQAALAESFELHRQLMPIVASAPLLREETKTIIFKFLFFNRGLILNSQGNYQAAVKNFEKSIHLDNEFTISFLGLGIACYHLGHYAKAARAFRSIQAIMKSHGLSRWDTEMTIDVLSRDQGTRDQGTQKDLRFFRLARDLDLFILEPIPTGKPSKTDNLKQRLIWRVSSEFVEKLISMSLDAQEIKKSAKDGKDQDDEGETSSSEYTTIPAPDNVLPPINKGKERKIGDYASGTRFINPKPTASTTSAKVAEHTNSQNVVPAKPGAADNSGKDSSNIGNADATSFINPTYGGSSPSGKVTEHTVFKNAEASNLSKPLTLTTLSPATYKGKESEIDIHESTFGYINIMLDVSSLDVTTTEHTKPKNIAAMSPSEPLTGVTLETLLPLTYKREENTSDTLETLLPVAYKREENTKDNRADTTGFIDVMLDVSSLNFKITKHTGFGNAEATNLSEPLPGTTQVDLSPTNNKGKKNAKDSHPGAITLINLKTTEHTKSKNVAAASPSEPLTGITLTNLSPAANKGKKIVTENQSDAASLDYPVLDVFQANANVKTTEHARPKNIIVANPSELRTGFAPVNRPRADNKGKEKANDNHPNATNFVDEVLSDPQANVKVTENADPEEGEVAGPSEPMTGGTPANSQSPSFLSTSIGRMTPNFLRWQRKKGNGEEATNSIAPLTGAPTTKAKGKEKSVAWKKLIKPMASIPAGNIAEPIHKGQTSTYADLQLYLNNATTGDATDYSPGLGYHQAMTEVAKSPSWKLSRDGFPYAALRPKLYVSPDYLRTPPMQDPVSYHDTVTNLAARRIETAARSSPWAEPATYQSPTREATAEELLYHAMQRDMVTNLVASEAGSPTPAPISPILETSTAMRGSYLNRPLPPLPNFRIVHPLAPTTWTPPAAQEVLMPVVYVRPEDVAAAPHAPISPIPASPPLRRVSVPVEQLGPALSTAVADADAKTTETVEEKRRVRKEATGFLKEATTRRRLALGMDAVPAPLPVFRVEDWTEGPVAGPSSAPLGGGSSGFSPVVGNPRAVTDAVAPYHRPGEWVPHVEEILDLYFRPGDDVLVTPVEE